MSIAAVGLGFLTGSFAVPAVGLGTVAVAAVVDRTADVMDLIQRNAIKHKLKRIAKRNDVELECNEKTGDCYFYIWGDNNEKVRITAIDQGNINEGVDRLNDDLNTQLAEAFDNAHRGLGNRAESLRELNLRNLEKINVDNLARAFDSVGGIQNSKERKAFNLNPFSKFKKNRDRDVDVENADFEDIDEDELRETAEHRVNMVDSEQNVEPTITPEAPTPEREEQHVRPSTPDNVGNWFSRAFNRNNRTASVQSSENPNVGSQNATNEAEDVSFENAEDLNRALEREVVPEVRDAREVVNAMEEGSVAQDDEQAYDIGRDTYTDEQIRQFIDENAIPNDFTEEEWQRGGRIERDMRRVSCIDNPDLPANELFADKNKENCVRKIGRGCIL